MLTGDLHMETRSFSRSLSLQDYPDTQARREAGLKLVRSMVRLSVPSFLTVASVSVIWAVNVFAPDYYRPSSPIMGLVIVTGLLALMCQYVTVPKATVLLYKQFRQVPPKSRLVSVLLFCVCLAGTGVLVVFAAVL